MKRTTVFMLCVAEVALAWNFLPRFGHASTAPAVTSVGVCIDEIHLLILHERACTDAGPNEAAELVRRTIDCLSESFRFTPKHGCLVRERKTPALLAGLRVTALQHWQLQCEWRRRRRKWKEARRAINAITAQSSRAVRETRDAVRRARRVRDGARRNRAAHARLVRADARWRQRVMELDDIVRRGEALVGRLRGWRERWNHAAGNVEQLIQITRTSNIGERRSDAREDFHAVAGVLVHGIVVVCCLRRSVKRSNAVAGALFLLDIGLTCDGVNESAWATRLVSALVCVVCVARMRRKTVIEAKSIKAVGKVRCSSNRKRVGCGRRTKNCGQAVFLARCIKQ